jgi:hypothetical protein
MASDLSSSTAIPVDLDLEVIVNPFKSTHAPAKDFESALDSSDDLFRRGGTERDPSRTWTTQAGDLAPAGRSGGI